MKLGVDVPAVYFVDSERNLFIMERIEDEVSAKDFIESLRTRSDFIVWFYILEKRRREVFVFNVPLFCTESKIYC